MFKLIVAVALCLAVASAGLITPYATPYATGYAGYAPLASSYANTYRTVNKGLIAAPWTVAHAPIATVAHAPIATVAHAPIAYGSPFIGAGLGYTSLLH